jgi:hypothetical protein
MEQYQQKMDDSEIVPLPLPRPAMPVVEES